MTEINEDDLAEMEGTLNRWGHSWRPAGTETDFILRLIDAYREQATENARLNRKRV